MMDKSKVLNRISAKLAPPTDQGCRLWRGAVNNSGQGIVSVDGKQQSVRRVVYSLAYKEVPKKMYVRVTCGNVLCCTPEHLEIARTPHDKLFAAQPDPETGELFIGTPNPAPDLTVGGVTKNLLEWMDDPRVTASMHVIRQRLRSKAKRDAHNVQWMTHPDMAAGWEKSREHPCGYWNPVWTDETALFTPSRDWVSRDEKLNRYVLEHTLKEK
jgi:hypothetical protein